MSLANDRPVGAVSLRPQRVAHNTSWNLADLAVSLVVGTITSIVVARGLGPTVLGSYQFVIWMASIVSTISLYGVPLAASRNIGQHLAAGEPGLAGAVLRATLVIQTGIAVVAMAAGMLLVFTLLPPGERLFGGIAFVAILPSLMMAIPTSINALDDRFSRNVIPSISAAVLEMTGAVLVVVLDLGLVGLASMSLLARTLDCSMRTAGAWSRMRDLLRQATVLPADVRARFVRMAKEAAAMQLLAFAVWNRSEILFLEWLSTEEQIAFFSLAYGLGTRIGMLPVASARTFTPAILRSYGVDPVGAVATAARAVRIQAFLGYPLFAALAITAGPLIAVMYGTEYLPAIPAVVVLAVATAFPVGRNSLEALLRAADHQKAMLVLYGAMTVVTLLLDWALISAYASVGAAIANGIILVSQGGALFLLSRRHTSLRWSDLALGRLLLITAVAGGLVWTLTRGLSPIAAIVVRPPLVIAIFIVGINLPGGLSSQERTAMAALASRARERLRRRRLPA